MRLIFTVFLLVATALAGEVPTRQTALEHRLMAPCCYNGLVASHQSGAASEMRSEISSMLSEGKSDREILAYFVQKHGKRILAEPEGEAGILLKTVPVVACIAGVVVLALVLRKSRAAQALPVASGIVDIDVPED